VYLLLRVRYFYELAGGGKGRFFSKVDASIHTSKSEAIAWFILGALLLP